MAEKRQKSAGLSDFIWKSGDINLEDARFINAGVDVGSVSSQAVIMADGRIASYSSMRTGFDSAESGLNTLRAALDKASIPYERIDYCVGTGYGRVNVPAADRTITEIACHARGANFMYGPQVRTVLDVGGQDIKAILCDEKGKVSNFLMNDKCAAGTGRGMEVFADLLEIPVTEVGERSFQYEGEEPDAVTNTCVVYAKSEAAGLLRKGWAKEPVLAAYCRATSERIFSLLDRLGVVPEFAVTGGMAKNRGVMDRLMPLLKLRRMKGEWDPQIAGAVGAALFAYALAKKGKKRKRKILSAG